MIVIHVPGVPLPQGSPRAFVRGGVARVVSGATSEKTPLGGWRARIAHEASVAMRTAGLQPISGPVSVSAIFTLPRPKSAPKKRWAADRRPDLDKLTRAVLDGLTSIVYLDDCQVVDMSCRKVLAGDALNLAFECHPGLLLVVVDLDADGCWQDCGPARGRAFDKLDKFRAGWNEWRVD